jgi:phage-related holin
MNVHAIMQKICGFHTWGKHSFCLLSKILISFIIVRYLFSKLIYNKYNVKINSKKNWKNSIYTRLDFGIINLVTLLRSLMPPLLLNEAPTFKNQRINL